MITVAVGSRNPVKVKAVETVFSKFFHRVSVISVDVRTSVFPQPIGLDETIRGALERAFHAIQLVKDADYGVGIEAGLMDFKHAITGYLDLQVCAIVDRSERFTLGTSSAFEFPPEVVGKVIRGEARESEEVFEEITGIKDIGSKTGAIGFLTKGEVTRLDLTVQSVIAALVPRINLELYEARPWPKVSDVLSK